MNKHNMNLISVIIPVYNVEKYLEECLTAVLAQTYQHLEIILVNDGSTDSSPAICDAYAQKDSRIQVIHKENGGLSDARNFGLREAKGAYIVFVDSDDKISIHFCEKLLEVLLEHHADIAECDFIKFTNSQEIVPEIDENKDGVGIFSAEQALEELIKERQFKQVVWNKIYRREVIGNFEFPVGKLNEDEFWTYKIFGNAKKIIKIPDVLHYYRQQEESIMGVGYNLRRLDGLLAMEERIDYISRYFPALKNLAIKNYCIGSLWHYQKIEKHAEIDSENVHRKKIKKSVIAYNQLSIRKNWSLKENLWYQFFLVSPQGYSKLRNYIKVGI